MKPTDLLHPEQRRPSKAYLANALREAIYAWRKEGYPNTTPTTNRLLRYWFEEDHALKEGPFVFWFCQREAIETLIYVYEVMKKRNFIDLAREFGEGPIQGYDPSTDQYPLYAFKMATGSGKTFVMALSIVWQYFNHRFENKTDYTSQFLLIAGEKNVIYDRLTRDFGDGKIFRYLPLIPPEWQDEFNLSVILKEDPIYVIPDEVLFITNIQQLEKRHNKRKEAEEYVNRIMDIPEVYNVSDIYQEDRIREVLTSCPNIAILKDEAHHIYDSEKAWKKILLELHKKLVTNYGKGINMELDFSATPKNENGALFPWIIDDFSLKEAIEMNIVKLPLKGVVKDAQEIASTNPVERYRAWLNAGVRRWREYKEKLKVLSKKPVLFIQCPYNEDADTIFDFINTIPDLKDKVLLIHTDSTGEIKKSDLPKAREFAKSIDDPDPDKNPYEAVVSNMMLNEGWDVRSVNVIVGLRTYGSERKVLPEQVIGRGLRKMFPDENANVEKSINILEVIGPPGLTEILEDLEQEEGIKIAEFDTSKAINITSIYVDEKKLEYDIDIPVLSPRIIIREFELEEINFDELPSLAIPLKDKDFSAEYVGISMLDKTELIHRHWDLPVPQDSKSVIAYYTQEILKQLRLGSIFDKIYPIVKRYVIEKLFVEPVDLDDPRVLLILSSPFIQEKILKVFVDSLKDITFKEREPIRVDVIKLSTIRPFVWSQQVYAANKCIFNYATCDNNFEVNFAKFLDRANDVKAFVKLVPRMNFYVEYRDSKGNLRFYYPDFVITTAYDEHIIVETKGEVDVEVEFKDRRIKTWCEDATKVTGEHWSYKRVNQEDFERFRYKTLQDLLNSIID
jgi:type III restriction enzyme